MQFYLSGYKPGDPFIEDPHPSVAERPEGLPKDADVLIVGCGPAGLVLAAQMANFPEIRTVVIDRKEPEFSRFADGSWRLAGPAGETGIQRGGGARLRSQTGCALQNRP